MGFEERLNDLIEVVREIPPGHVMSYGQVGRMMTRPVGPRMAGRLMFSLDSLAEERAVPWWRVLASDGSLSIAKRSPELAQMQRQLLEDEGIEFKGQRVPKSAFL